MPIICISVLNFNRVEKEIRILNEDPNTSSRYEVYTDEVYGDFNLPPGYKLTVLDNRAVVVSDLKFDFDSDYDLPPPVPRSEAIKYFMQWLWFELTFPIKRLLYYLRLSKIKPLESMGIDDDVDGAGEIIDTLQLSLVIGAITLTFSVILMFIYEKGHVSTSWRPLSKYTVEL